MKQIEMGLGLRNPPLTAGMSPYYLSRSLLSKVSKENKSLDKYSGSAYFYQAPKAKGKRKMSGFLTSSFESYMKARTSVMETLSPFLTTRPTTS